MSQFKELRAGLAWQIDRAVAMAARATLAPMLLRLTVAVAALAGFAMAYPLTVVRSSAVIGLVLLAVAAALFPRGPLPTLVIASMVLGYLLSTTFDGRSGTTWRVIGVAAAIYVTHSASAFGAVLPYDSVARPGLFLPWVLRMSAVIVLTGLVALVVAVLPSFVGTHRLVIASVSGFVAMLALAFYLFYLWRRP